MIYEFIWDSCRWTSTDDTEEKLASLWALFGTPNTILIHRANKKPDTYRCNICGGLVQFDGTPPDSRKQPGPGRPPRVSPLAESASLYLRGMQASLAVEASPYSDLPRAYYKMLSDGASRYSAAWAWVIKPVASPQGQPCSSQSETIGST